LRPLKPTWSTPVSILAMPCQIKTNVRSSRRRARPGALPGPNWSPESPVRTPKRDLPGILDEHNGADVPLFFCVFSEIQHFSRASKSDKYASRDNEKHRKWSPEARMHGCTLTFPPPTPPPGRFANRNETDRTAPQYFSVKPFATKGSRRTLNPPKRPCGS
jgi:hypothetical protein